MILTREQARHEIRARWKEFGQSDKSGKGIVCPFCNNGSGADGDGIREDPRKPGRLKCFKCGWSGDSIDLYMKEWDVDYNDALFACADFLGITIENDAPAGRSATKAKGHAAENQGGGNHTGRIEGQQTGPAATEGAQIADYTDFYRECSQKISDPAAISYLQARGISQETAAAYNLGFDPAWISPEAIRRQRAKGSDWTPPATARLIMPVSRNHYVARAISPDIEKKYQKMNETGGGPACIFNLPAIRQKQPVFIVEGIIDALSIMEAGGQAVALNSTSNADQLIKRLESQHTDCSFVICPDNDDAGRRVAATLESGLQKLNIKHITVNISGDHKDANDALTADRQSFEQAVKEARAKAAPADYLTEFLNNISGENYRPYTTDIEWFDGLLSGGPVRQTVLSLLAAPAAGKTTLCQQIAESMARHGKPVLYLNLEMTRDQMLAKSISSRCTFKGQKMSALDVLQGYRWNDQQRQAVRNAAAEYREQIMPYLSYNPDGVTGDFDTLKNYLDRTGEGAKAGGRPAPVVVLDYLHLVSCKGQDVQETVKQSMDMLKQYAMKFDTFCIAITATNRESNKAGRITMESGRDSSGIEYGGDYILSLNYYQMDKGDVKPGDTEKVAILQRREWRQMIIRVLKGRLCIPGRSARVYFHAAGNRFYSEDAFIPADADIICFDDKDPELEAPGVDQAVKQRIAARF